MDKHTELISRLQDEADLCRNDGATDIAALLDEAVEALRERNHDTAVGEKWRTDSRLKEWFPMTADRLAALEADAERLQAENFALAAGQCVNVTADEGGRPQCKQIETLRGALRWIAGVTTQTPGLSDSQLGKLLGGIQECAERALKA